LTAACYRKPSIATTRLLGDLHITLQISWRYAGRTEHRTQRRRLKESWLDYEAEMAMSMKI
jgi:hypothetical protein